MIFPPNLCVHNNLNLIVACNCFMANKLTMKNEKTQTVLVSTRKCLMLNNPESVKFLGVLIDPDLLRRTAYMVNFLADLVSLDVLLQAYCGLF